MIGELYNCKPTLNDKQVLDFCYQGFLKFEAVVPDEVNRRTVEFCNEHAHGEPSGILDQAWFDQYVIKNEQAASAVRCLLSKNFQLPSIMSNHRNRCPWPAQNWHRDGGSIYTRQLNYLQVFYYPEDTPPEMGPTEIVPGSHFARHKATYMQHMRGISSATSTAAPAGTIFITAYGIWHRRSKSTASGIRNLLKYNYWRTTKPCRDWIIDPDFSFSWPEHDPHPMFEQFKRGIAAVEMFSWLCGEDYEHVGGQCWPAECTTPPRWDQAGLPAGLRKYPDPTPATLP